jgi:nucleotide-binding universal stress UspA family protein
MANPYPFSRVLLATELTEFDAGAERIAFAMAQRCGVPLRVVVPLLSNPEFEADMPELALRAEEEAAQRIGALRSRAATANVVLDVCVRRGAEAHPEIVAEAKAAQTDLIVLRRRGRQGFLARILVGEMVSKVIRDVSCCVLLVPRAAQFWTQGIVAAVADAGTAPKIAKTAGLIAAICDLPLTVLSVAGSAAAQAEMQRINDAALASAAGATAQGQVVVGRPAEQVVAAAVALKADLMVLGRQRYQLFPLARSGVMQDIAGSVDMPTLVVPA